MTDPRQIQLIMELRGQGIDDPRVLDAIERTPRDLFVDKPLEYAAFNNTALPIACGQTISQPYVVAYMTQHLDVQPNMRVLEIGTGSGYQAAVLSPLCRRVYTMERHRPLLEQALARCQGAQAPQHRDQAGRRLSRLAGAGAVRPHHPVQRGGESSGRSLSNS